MDIKLILMLLNKMKDEQSRKQLLIFLLVPFICILIVFTLIVYILGSPLLLLTSYFSGSDEYNIVQSFKSENDCLVEGYVDLSFNGVYPLPFEHDGDVTITDNYGYRIHPITGEHRMHWGIDFATIHHCEIKSIADGTVTFAGIYGTYGNTVIIRHETLTEIFYSLYAHLSEINVTEGQIVKQGEMIGLEGGSADDSNHGDSTGHHLHFGIMDSDGSYVDPTKYIFVK